MSKYFEMMQQSGLARDFSPGSRSDELSEASKEATARKPLRTPELVNNDWLFLEECRNLVDQIFLTDKAEERREVVFAGVDRGNGCSRICADTARVLAHNTSGSVCLVDANLRSPSQADFFGVPNHYGLTDALVEPEPVRHFATQLGQDNLWLLSAGSSSANTSGVMNSPRVKTRFAELRKEFDFVLIDTPPLTQYADAGVLARFADGLVVVLEANSTRRESALKEIQNLRQSNVRVLGAVLNKRTFPIPQSVYDKL
jgi:protein-tyrosine kinase